MDRMMEDDFQTNGDAAGPAKRRKTTNIYVTEAPKFDLESYISNYRGRTRLDRLRTIGICSKVLGPDALRRGVIESRNSKDADAYRDFVQLYQDLGSSQKLPELEEGSASKIEAIVSRETERLENDLKGYKNNLIKESIRLGNDDLGQHLYRSGNLSDAYRAFNRMREYCTLPKHAAEMSLKLILTSVAQEAWMLAQNQLYKLSALSLKPEDKAKFDPAVAPITGLTHMCSGNYKDAAKEFLNTDPAFSTLEPIADIKANAEILTPNDVATYGGLCALATLNRGELQARVLDNGNFRSFLELESHLRRAIVAFCNAKYTACLEILDSYRPDFLLDIHLQRHVDAIYAAIRRKSIIAYTAPFSRVGIAEMAKAFSATVDGMEKELTDMIRSGDLKARLDVVEMVLVGNHEDRREALQEKALRVAKGHERDLRLRVFRINMLLNGFEVKAPKKQGGQGFEGDDGGFGRVTRGMGRNR